MSVAPLALALLLAQVAGPESFVADGESSFIPSRDVLHAPLKTSGHWPARGLSCEPELFCYAEVVAAACVVTCYDDHPFAPGAQVVSVTPGVGATCEASQFVPEVGGTGRVGMRIAADAQSPSIPAGVVSPLWPASHTVVMVGAAGLQSGASLTGWFHDRITSVSGFTMYGTNTFLICGWGNAAGSGLGTSASAPLSGISQRALVSSCRWNASTKVGTARANGYEASTPAWDVQPAAGAQPAYIGSYGGIANRSFSGPWWLLVVYPCGLAPAEIAREFEGKWSGALAENRGITNTRAGTACWEASDGYVYCVGDGFTRCDARGCVSEDLRTNYWLNSSDASSWSNVAAPTVNVNVESGPLSRLLGAAEADEIVDDDAANVEGKSLTGPAVAGAGEKWTVSCYLKAGQTGTTTTKASLATWATGGAISSSQCNLTLTSAWARYSCPSNVSTGAAANVYGYLYTSNQAADTGSIRVSHCQLEPGASASQPIPAGSVAAIRLADILTVGVAGWPVRQGEFEITYEPTATRPTGGYDYIIDTRPGGGATSEGVRSYIDQNGALVTYVGSAAAVTGASSGVLTWTVRTRYKIRIRWGDGNLWVWRNNVLVASSTSGVGTMPTGHPGGSLGGTFLQADGWLSLDAVRR